MTKNGHKGAVYRHVFGGAGGPAKTLKRGGIGFPAGHALALTLAVN